VADDPQPQPRRRMTDRDRRRWTDQALDMLKDDVDDVQSEQRAIAALYRRLAPLPELLERYMKTTDARLDRMHTALENLRDENRLQHRRVAYGMDPEDGKTPLPPQPALLTWGGVAKVATIMGTFFGAAAVIVAALLSAG
jgi:hypothetical protein